MCAPRAAPSSACPTDPPGKSPSGRRSGAAGRERVRSATLLNALTDFSEPGPLADTSGYSPVLTCGDYVFVAGQTSEALKTEEGPLDPASNCCIWSAAVFSP